MANPKWARWIHASIATYLKSVASLNSIPSLVDGIEQRTAAFSEAPDKVEFRVNGPFTRELSENYYEAKVGINVLVSSTIGGPKKDAFRLDDILGLFHEALDEPIPVFDYSLTISDPGYQLGCLKLVQDKLGLRVLHFGQIDPNDLVRQGMVSGNYYIELRG